MEPGLVSVTPTHRGRYANTQGRPGDFNGRHVFHTKGAIDVISDSSARRIAAAAAQLGAITSSLAAQNAGAAAPTTAIAPAAADQVSIMQSGIFTAYGALYQQIAAEAQALQEQFVQTLGLSSGTYESSEAANAAAATLTDAASAAAAAPAASSRSTTSSPRSPHC